MENENNNYDQPQNNDNYEQSQSQDTYNQDAYNQQYGQQSYNQQYNQQYGQQTYNQQYNQQYGQQYGQPYYNMNGAPTDENGNPIKNRFGMKLTFSILEMISCNLISLVCGIIGCVYTSKANTSYKEGRWEDFKSQAKSATISLWIGLVGVILNVILFVFIIVFSIATGFAVMDEIVSDPDFNYEYEYSYDDTDEYDYYYDDTEIFDSEYDDFYDDDYADSEENTEDVVPQEPLNVIPGEGFTDPSITLNGAYMELPLSYAELTAYGFYIEEEDEAYVLNKNEYDTPTLYDSTGTYIGYAYIGNLTEDPLPLKDCVVFGFDLMDMEAVDFSFNNGLNKYATSEDVKNAYGAPDYEYEDDESDYQSYQWYNHSDVYEDADENSIEIVFWEGELSEVIIRYIGWD